VLRGHRAEVLVVIVAPGFLRRSTEVVTFKHEVATVCHAGLEDLMIGARAPVIDHDLSYGFSHGLKSTAR
jgi:hypothetical protein